MRRLSFLLMAALLLTGCGGGGTPELRVSEAQAALPVAGSSQVVVSVLNDGDGGDKLVGADTDAALAVEIHRTEMVDGRTTMSQLDGVDIGPGEELRFRPGGLHLMLVVPREQVTEGGTFDLTLSFEQSGDITVPVTVTELLDLYEDSFEDAGDPDDGSVATPTP